MSKLMVILGITGTQGGSVADIFLQEPGWKIRGLTRDPKKTSSAKWEVKGIEMVQADVDDFESLKRALQGAHAIFAVTDFWGPMYDQRSYGRLQLGQTISEYCYELEVRRGINIANAAACIETLERFVFSGLPGIKSIAGGKYQYVYHFDAKAEIGRYIQESLPKLNEKTSQLLLGEYATNWKMWRLRRPNKEDGLYAFLLPGDSKTLTPFVVPRKDTGHFVRALVMLPPGKLLLGYGSLPSHEEYVRLWTQVFGVEDIRIKRVTVDEAAAFEGGPHGLELAVQVASVLQLDLSGEFILHPSQIPKEIGCPTTSLEDYMKSEDFSSLVDLN
ncbi:hscarg dehydrogenase, putative [Talaromyces stipitatus ATCC 10500]|uniref:Hscarg dehydrogenase, putative n=1 Tax=Talaromyces stipitatus (strain ATCC 10500 / CBS 375.48 / QM 6759 / NRRL 1006) TaxID=441959 RepID=B8MB10_TALSN|nr:hscarg dehydrogenase, putative [Talaromyces stipitatus ATCC 10500]EED18711.1 hscarg dehydrogenase, putative [Talaromyces stipitatus ATCC 10500]